MLSAKRPAHRVRAHYEIERELADQLRRADREERTKLFPQVYDQLFERVPDHPQLAWKSNQGLRVAQMDRRVRSLHRFLANNSVYLELGVGDAALASAVARRVAKVYAVDVSEKILEGTQVPSNVELILSDGVSVPVPGQSVSIALSDQLIEHLHPEDACEQLENVCRAVELGGHYLVFTPNRLSGPHDVSRDFSETPVGFHLREYTNGELRSLLLKAGFSRVRRGFLSSRRLHIEYPLVLVILIENLVELLGPWGRRLARNPLFSLLLGCRVIATR